MSRETNASPPVLVYVLVITHNGKHHLEKCLPSLYATDFAHFRVILVDNNSTDGSADYVRTHYPKAEVMTHPQNFGFAKGNNLGIAVALQHNADFIVLLNDDTVILDTRWLAEAVVAAQDDRVGMVGFNLKSQTDVTIVPSVLVKPVEHIEGCALFIRSTLLRNLGLLDEVYFTYAEESDLEARAQRAGYRLVEISCPIYHLGGGTSKKHPARRSYLLMRNVIRYTIKNRGWIGTLKKVVRIADIACSPFPLTLDKNDSTHLGFRNTGNIMANTAIYLRALFWNLANLPKTLAIRDAEEKLIEQTKPILARTLQNASKP